MILYHGTNKESGSSIVNAGINVRHNPRSGDFGMGFYLTPDLARAKAMALRKAFDNSEPCVIELDIQDNSLLAYKSRIFSEVSIESSELEIMEWAQFIVNNRCGIDYVKKVASRFGYSDCNFSRYDLVVGTIADGSVALVARKCQSEKRIITFPEAKEFLEKSFGLQYCISTERGLSIIDGAPRIKEVSWI